MDLKAYDNFTPDSDNKIRDAWKLSKFQRNELNTMWRQYIFFFFRIQ